MNLKPHHCSWCMKDTRTTDKCEHCGSIDVHDPNKPHHPDWSRKTRYTWECKVCGRVIPNTDEDAINSRCTGQF
jgi:ribosomal protein S14